MLIDIPVSYTHLDVYKRQLWDYAQKHNITIEGLKPPVEDIEEIEEEE